MLIRIKSFNGHVLNDDSFEATGLNFGTPNTAANVFVDVSNNDSVPAGVFTRPARNLSLSVSVKNYTHRTDRFSLEGQLKVWFQSGTSGLLVVTFADDGQDYQIQGQVKSMDPDGRFPGYYVVILQAGASYWRRVSPVSILWNADATHLTQAITVGGLAETRLCASITPPNVTAVSGWKYQYLYQLVNVPGINYNQRSWCITIDTAALVADGKLRADCADLRVVLNDQEVRRYISDPNTDHTHVWINPTIGPGYSLQSALAIPSTGAIGEIQLVKTRTSQGIINALPASGFLVDGTEWMFYSGKDVKLQKTAISTRGTFGTAMQAHAAGSTFKYVANAIFVVFGNPSATDPALDDDSYDDDKPVFDLSLSDNTKWVYSVDSLFYDPDHPDRPGSWVPSLTAIGDVSAVYQDAANGTAGPAMGMEVGCYMKLARWQNENATAAWMFTSPGGIAEVTATGSKYRSTVRDVKMALQRGVNGWTYTDVWVETLPVNALTWTPFSRAAAAIGSLKYVRFVKSGIMMALANATAFMEILTATVKFTSTTLPSGTLLAEDSNYPLAIRLTNTTNGDSGQLIYPMKAGRTVVMDGEAYDLTYDGSNIHGALQLNDESRDVWIRAKVGTNNLQIDPVTTGDNIGNLAITLFWYPRRP
jgi:hypothetical protein